MSEAQQGPEIRDVISAKRYHFLFYFLNTQSEPLWGKEKCLIGPRVFSKLTPVIEFFSLYHFVVYHKLHARISFRVNSVCP